MSRRNVFTLIVGLSLMLIAWQPGTRGQQARASVSQSLRAAIAQGRPVHVIVGTRVNGYRPDGALAAAEATRQRDTIHRVSARVISRLPLPSAARARAFDFLPYFSALVDANALLQLESDPDVSSIQEDHVNTPALAESVPLIGSPLAWRNGATGAGWTVAILDTGVETSHSFLLDKTTSEGCFSNANLTGAGASLCPGGVGETTSTGSGINCSTAMVSPSCSHGTHVAGIAAGKGATFSGVAKDATIMPFQVFTNFGGGNLGAYDSDIIAAMNRVYALRGTFNIAAVNLSLGGSLYTDQTACDAANGPFKAAIDLLRSANIATIAASGDGSHFNAVASPACISSAISVGSTTKTDVVSSFSNAASFLNLLAPGEAITSSIPGNSFGPASGTSMAAAHVSGTWAVLKQQKPTAVVDEVLHVLQTTGVSLTDVRNGLAYPRIRVDAAAIPLTGPLLKIDRPLLESTLSAPFFIEGWAIDPRATAGTGIDLVHVWASPSPGWSAGVFLGAAWYGEPRPDVGSRYGSRFMNSGFKLTVPGSRFCCTVLPAPYVVTVYGRSTVTGTFDVIGRQTIMLQPAASMPGMALDQPQSGSTNGPSVFVSGWALDALSASGSGADAVQIWALPSGGHAWTFLGEATYGLPREDAALYLGARFIPSGFRFSARLAPGTYAIRAYMRSTVTGTFNDFATANDVKVLSSYPEGDIEVPFRWPPQRPPFEIRGWAADPGAPTGTGVDAVHVWAFGYGLPPIFIGAASYGQARPDIGALLGDARFNNSGFTILVNPSNLPNLRTYYFHAYALSSTSGSFADIDSLELSIQ